MSSMGDVWRYVDEKEIEAKLEIISLSSIEQMIALNFTNFHVETDVDFKLRAHDGMNPSRLTMRTIPELAQKAVYIDGFAEDRIKIKFYKKSVDAIQCVPGSGQDGEGKLPSKCGHGGTPPDYSSSEPMFFQSVHFLPWAPSARLARLSQGKLPRNVYTWNGTYYFVYARN
ncbi:echinolectin 1-like [Diadema antillarum]|uniref:echinolectin 1-like n=1 Tax=Diadema antillarum TaxID=105358 RepID=UPI003A8B5197